MAVLKDRVAGVHVGDHDEAALPLQRRLEEVCQFRIAVLRPPARPAPSPPSRLGQRVDAVGQRQQRLVDVGPLLQPHAAVQRRRGALGAGEVNQAEPRLPRQVVPAGVGGAEADADLECELGGLGVEALVGVAAGQRPRSTSKATYIHIHTSHPNTPAAPRGSGSRPGSPPWTRSCGCGSPGGAARGLATCP